MTHQIDIEAVVAETVARLIELPETISFMNTCDDLLAVIYAWHQEQQDAGLGGAS